MKRLLCVILLLAFTLTVYQPTAMAVTTSEDPIGPAAVINRINNASNSMSFTLQGDYGLLFNLKHLTKQVIWTGYAVEHKENSGIGGMDYFSASEVDILLERLKTNVAEFNKAYNNVESDYITPGPDLLGANSTPFQLLTGDIPRVVEEYFSNLQSGYDLLSEEEKQRYAQSKRSLLRELSTILEYGMGAKKLSDGFVTDAYDRIMSNPNYADMIRMAVAISEEELESYTEVKYKDADSYISALSNMMVTSSGIKADGDTYSLSAQYLAMVAASAVYIPFNSHTGDEDFMRALDNIINNNDEYEKISRLYMRVKNTKKPLYFVPNGRNIKEAERVTIDMFIKICGDEDTYRYGTFVMGKGILDRVEDDTDSWAYFGADFSKVSQTNLGTITTPSTTTTTTTPSGGTDDDDDNSSTTTPTTPQTTSPNQMDAGSSDTSSQLVFRAGNVQKMTDSYMMDTEILPDLSSCTQPVFGIAQDDPYFAGQGFGKADKDYVYGVMGKAIMTNIIKSTKTIERIPNRNMRLVYMNAFGDIVLDDNTVVLPGSANPYIYDKELGYSPYSAAFMNYIPDLVHNSERILLNSKDSEGKFILSSDGRTKDEKRDSLPANKYYINMLKDRWLLEDIKGEEQILPLYIHSMPVSVGGETTNLTMFESRDDAKGPLVKINWNLNGDPIFPYTKESESANSFIGRNMYWSYTTSTGLESETENQRVRPQYVIENIMYEALLGTDYNTYATDMQNTYDWYSNTMAGRFSKMIIDLCKPIVETVGSVDGILGVKSSYEDGILSKVIGVFETYVVFIMVAFAFMLVLIFMRRRATFIHTITLAAFVLCVILGMIRVVPVYIPIIYNSATQNIVSRLNYGILTSKMEMYFTNNSSDNKFIIDGKVNSNTGNVTIYKFNRSQLNELCQREAIDRNQLLAGKTYILDDKNGVYVEGDSMKISLDRLFSNPINGAYYGPDNNKAYAFQYYKMYSSNLDYYCPYNMITDNFIERLNAFIEIYNVPRHVVDYGGGFFKDSFAVYSYANSPLFLKPGNYDLGIDDMQVVMRLRDTFGNNKDFLGISELFYHTDDPLYRETLWWKTLEDNGYIQYNPDTMNLSDESLEKLDTLVEYVNYQTKKFIIEDLNSQLGSMSDDNMIKVISLYATFCFNNKASGYGNWLYPNNINFPESKLGDIMVGTFTDQYDKFIAMKYNILDYMYVKYDVFHAVLFVVDMVLCFLIAYIFKFTIPLMYILFCLLLIFNFVRGDDSKGLLKGYGKVLLKTVLLMMAFSGSFVLANAFNESAFGIWILLVCSGVILAFLFKTVMVVLHNPLTMGGNTTLVANNLTGNLFNRNHHTRRVNNMMTNNLQYNEKRHIIQPPEATDDRFVEYRIGDTRSRDAYQVKQEEDYRMMRED